MGETSLMWMASLLETPRQVSKVRATKVQAKRNFLCNTGAALQLRRSAHSLANMDQNNQSRLARLLFEMANNYLWIEGSPFPTSTIGDLRSWRDQFVVRDEDVITLSYPKSGKEVG